MRVYAYLQRGVEYLSSLRSVAGRSPGASSLRKGETMKKMNNKANGGVKNVQNGQNGQNGQNSKSKNCGKQSPENCD